jgi:ferrous-iron efflux pump FieF
MKAAGVASVAVAFTLIGLKLWAWLLTGSVAVLSSLADSLLDLVASLITLLAVRFAVEPPDREHRFGHGKSEGVAGLAQALIVTISAGYVGFRAIARLIRPVRLEAPEIGFGVMTASLVLTAGLVLFQHYVTRRTKSLAIAADATHYRGDLLTSSAVIVAIFLSTRYDWTIADPLLGLVIVAVILASVWGIVRTSLDDLLDRELANDRRARIQAIAMAHEAVLGLHDLRTRSAGVHEFIQFHLELDPRMRLEDAHAISDEVESALRREFPAADILIHADPYGLDESRDDFDGGV